MIDHFQEVFKRLWSAGLCLNPKKNNQKSEAPLKNKGLFVSRLEKDPDNFTMQLSWHNLYSVTLAWNSAVHVQHMYEHSIILLTVKNYLGFIQEL